MIGVQLEQSIHTVTFLPAGRSQSSIISKTDVDQHTSASSEVATKATMETDDEEDDHFTIW